MEPTNSLNSNKFNLRHLSGITGHILNSMIFDKNGDSIISISGENLLVTPLSGPLSQEQLQGSVNKSRQEFLKGHDDSVTCLDTAHGSDLIASGQSGNNSDVLVW